MISISIVIVVFSCYIAHEYLVESEKYQFFYVNATQYYVSFKKLSLLFMSFAFMLVVAVEIPLIAFFLYKLFDTILNREIIDVGLD
jgi:hypothetical protein